MNNKNYALDFKRGHDDYKAGRAASGNQSEAYNEGYSRAFYNGEAKNHKSLNQFGVGYSR